MNDTWVRDWPKPILPTSVRRRRNLRWSAYATAFVVLAVSGWWAVHGWI